jgi:Mrp family chromosome partitioning ATPase
MSRNFELLQRLSRDQEMFDTGADSLSSPLLVPPPRHQEREGKPVELKHPRLEMEEKQRDEIMKCVQHVFLMERTEAPRTVVLTGIESGTGCTWICCRAAQILASQVKGPVCVVDANLRSPGLHQYFGVDNHYGLSDALRGTESIRDFVCPLGGGNLWLLSCGSNATDSHTRLISDPMRLRLAELREYFEYVLIDAPALSLGIDGIALGRAAEGVVLVLKANASRRDAARKAVLDLQSAGARILGAVLNQRSFPIPQAIYTKL